MAHDMYKRVELSQQQVGALASIALLSMFFVFMVGYRCGKTCSDELTTDSFGDRLYYTFVCGREPLLGEAVQSAYTERYMSEQDARQAVARLELQGLKAHCAVQESSTVGGALYRWYRVEIEKVSQKAGEADLGLPRESSKN